MPDEIDQQLEEAKARLDYWRRMGYNLYLAMGGFLAFGLPAGKGRYLRPHFGRPHVTRAR